MSISAFLVQSETLNPNSLINDHLSVHQNLGF